MLWCLISEEQNSTREFNYRGERTKFFLDENNVRKEEEEEEEAYVQDAHTYALEPLLIIFRPRRGSRRAVKGCGRQETFCSV